MQLTIEIAATYPVHIPQADLVHSNQEIELIVVLVPQLAGRFAGTADTRLGQFAAGRGIDWISNLLGTGRYGFDMELALQARFLTKSLTANSAIGLRHILLWQIKSIFVITLLLHFGAVFSVQYTPGGKSRAAFKWAQDLSCR